jgi:hypothetical protein
MVEQIIENRRAAGISPIHATFLDLNNEVSKALASLETDGKIKIGDTINDKYIVLR